MSEAGKVRMRVSSPVTQGGVVKVRVLILHPMEGIQRDKNGKVIDRDYNFIDRVVVTYGGRRIAEFETTQAVSENPYFTFPLKADQSDTLRVTFHDTSGKTYEAATEIKFR